MDNLYMVAELYENDESFGNNQFYHSYDAAFEALCECVETNGGSPPKMPRREMPLRQKCGSVTFELWIVQRA